MRDKLNKIGKYLTRTFRKELFLLYKVFENMPQILMFALPYFAMFIPELKIYHLLLCQIVLYLAKVATRGHADFPTHAFRYTTLSQAGGIHIDPDKRHMADRYLYDIEEYIVSTGQDRWINGERREV